MVSPTRTTCQWRSYGWARTRKAARRFSTPTVARTRCARSSTATSPRCSATRLHSVLASCRSCLKCLRRPAALHSGSSEQAGSEIGFAKENAAGIPLDAAERNYKDPNHKPELVFALTPFLAMNAFREFNEIAALLQPVASAHPAIGEFLSQPDAEHLSQLFAGLLNMQGEEKRRLCACCKPRWITNRANRGRPSA